MVGHRTPSLRGLRRLRRRRRCRSRIRSSRCRMGYLLDTMTPKTVDAQRDVVKNERRQSYENRPYGQSEIVLGEMLYPVGHPYHWPVIGYMEDLTAASYDDVVQFFKKYYAPSN